MNRTIKPFGLRLPPELKAQLKTAARRNRRSLNSEIIDRLQNSDRKTAVVINVHESGQASHEKK